MHLRIAHEITPEDPQLVLNIGLATCRRATQLLARQNVRRKAVEEVLVELDAAATLVDNALEELPAQDISDRRRAMLQEAFSSRSDEIARARRDTEAVAVDAGKADAAREEQRTRMSDALRQLEEKQRRLELEKTSAILAKREALQERLAAVAEEESLLRKALLDGGKMEIEPLPDLPKVDAAATDPPGGPPQQEGDTVGGPGDVPPDVLPGAPPNPPPDAPPQDVDVEEWMRVRQGSNLDFLVEKR